MPKIYTLIDVRKNDFQAMETRGDCQYAREKDMIQGI